MRFQLFRSILCEMMMMMMMMMMRMMTVVTVVVVIVKADCDVGNAS